MKSGNIYWRVALLAYCGVIFLLSSRSDYPDLTWYPGGLPDPHYIAHFVLYGGLGYVAWNTFSSENAGAGAKKRTAVAIIFCALYGVSDEFHQIYVPGRTFEIIDLVIDIMASSAMVMAVSIRAGRKRRTAIERAEEKYAEDPSGK